MPGATINVATVRRIVRQGRVVPHPSKYHAGRHGIGFQECVAALEHCYAVHPDPRRDLAWFALSMHTHHRILRVDFDAHVDQDGTLILIVTAYHP